MPPIMLLIGLASSHYQIPSFFIFTYLLIFIYFLILTSRKGSPIVVITLISIMLYFILKDENIVEIQLLVTMSYQYILGVLLGEVLQSSWTIAKLTFSVRVHSGMVVHLKNSVMYLSSFIVQSGLSSIFMQ